MAWSEEARKKAREAIKRKAEQKLKSEAKKEVNSAKRKIKKEVKSETKKQVKKITTLTVCLMVVFAIVGIAGGWITYTQICKNDTFEVIGEKNITLNIGDSYTYTEQGVKIISYGKDISNKVKIKTNIPENGILDTSFETEYYVIYTVDDANYGDIQKVRVITVGGAE